MTHVSQTNLHRRQRRRHWLRIWAGLLLVPLGWHGLMALTWPTQVMAIQAQAAVASPLPAPDIQTPGAALSSNSIVSVQPLTTPVPVAPVVTATAILYLPLVAQPDLLTPRGPYPPDGALEQSPNVFLTWSSLAPVAEGVSYDLYLAENPQPSVLVAQGLRKASFDPTTFTPDTQYYWQVVASDSLGRQSAGPVWRFRVEPVRDPPAIGSMVHIPAGEFLMGCDRQVDTCVSDGLHEEEPLHPIYLDEYMIDKYEVTNVEYRACRNAGVCPSPRRGNSRGRNSYFENPSYDLFPVIYVSWWDAQAYCGWVGKHLPTEAEWEKAARGPIDTRPQLWGSEPIDCSRANVNADCVHDTARVGSYPTGASPYGLMDMAGNVFEWVQDKYDVLYYSYSPYANPQGPVWSRTHVDVQVDLPHRQVFTLRGGSFHDRLRYNRVAHRHWGHHGDEPFTDEPFFRNFRVGFRCARSGPPS